MALNYHHLRLFRAVAREGGVGRAAERLHISQSAISVQLRSLEAALGHALFERTGRRLVLTEEGRIALDYADTVFEAGDAMVRTLEGRPPGKRHVFGVGALTTLSRNFQIEFLQPLVGREDVHLVVRSGVMRELLSGLAAHTLDVVLANSALLRDAASDLHSHRLASQPVSLVSRRPAAGAPPFDYPGALAHEPVILPTLESGYRAAFDSELALAGIQPRILAEVDDMAMLRLFARETGALALVPPIVVRDELATGVLVERHRLRGVAESFYAIVQNRRFPNPLLAQVLRARTNDGPLGGLAGAP